MTPDASIIKRLAFIKYLYKVAVEQSYKPEPLCYPSILTFHDSVELFLQLLAEQLRADISKKKINRLSFMEYWDYISPKLKENSLSHKIPMQRLNKTRVDLKHHGIFPSKTAIEDFRMNVTNFFEENTSLVFNIQFSDISLIDLVQCEKTRKLLKEAEGLLNENGVEEALQKVTLAFHLLLGGYQKHDWGFLKFIGRRVNIPNSHQIASMSLLLDKPEPELQRDLKVFIDNVKEYIEYSSEALKVLCLGIDYRRYAKFKLITPNFYRNGYGKYHFEKYLRSSKIKISSDNVQFGVDFVIEAAIAIQEFDFSLEEK